MFIIFYSKTVESNYVNFVIWLVGRILFALHCYKRSHLTCQLSSGGWLLGVESGVCVNPVLVLVGLTSAFVVFDGIH